MPLNDVPMSGLQTLGATQALIRGNFTTINDVFEIDHVSYGTAGQGKHNQVTFPTHIGPIPTIGAPIATEFYLFNQTAAPSGVPDLWLKRGAGTPYPITATITDIDLNGWTRLPSGILLKWGQTSGGFLVGNTWTTVTFPTAATIPVFTAIYSVQLTPKVVTAAPSTAQTTTLVDLNSTFEVTGFQVFNRRTDGGFGINADCTYLAIGI